MRLFIAIQLNDEMKDLLQDMQKKMRSYGVRGNYTKRDNLHLTLAFIGEHDDPERILEVMKSVELRPFSIRTAGTGSFRKLWWAGIDGGAALEAYTRRLRRALEQADIPFDRKKFSPHITLVRTPECKGDMTEREIPDALCGTEPAGMTVDHASLMKSERGDRGMVYTEIR